MKNADRCPLRYLVLVFSILIFTENVFTETSADPGIPDNVLLITVDTLRADRVSCYDPAHVETPNMDALARRGTQFLQAYAHASMTLPSHASILLGTTPVRHGVHDNGYFIVRPEHLTLAEHLKTHGYRTAAFVSANPLDSRFGLSQGFDVYGDDFMPSGSGKNTKAEQKADVSVAKALNWLKSAHSKKWFLWLHLYDPHAPYDPPEPFGSRFKGRRYDGEVAFVDSSLGKLFAAIEKDEMSRRTIIILTADHGESLGDHGESTHGFFAYNSTLRVPLIIMAPGKKPLRPSEPACHADLVPTICDLLGVAVPAGLQGISLLPAMEGKSLPSRRIYFESLAPYYAMGWAPLVGYLEKSEKFIDSPIPEIYDLSDDPDEKSNLAGKADPEPYRANFRQLVQALSPPRALDARARVSSELKKQLETLGYLTRPAGIPKKEFGPEDDVKTMLPIYLRIESAFALEKQGKRQEAIIRLENLIREPKTLDTAYARLGELYLSGGNAAKAIEAFRTGFSLFPSSFDLLFNLAENLLAEDRPEEVLQVLRESNQTIRMENSAAIWNIEGVTYKKLNDPLRAVESFRRAVDADSEFVDALYNLGSTALSLGLQTMDPQYLAEAIRSLGQVTELVPVNADAHNSLGAALFSAGQIDQAILAWEKALELKPDLIRVNYFLGTAHYQRNNPQEALHHLQIYKSAVYLSLTLEEKANLDLLIQRCQPVKR